MPRKKPQLSFYYLFTTLTAMPMTSLATSGSLLTIPSSGYIAGVWVEFMMAQIPAGLILGPQEVDRKLAGYDTMIHHSVYIGAGGSPENWGHKCPYADTRDKGGKRFYVDVYYSAGS